MSLRDGPDVADLCDQKCKVSGDDRMYGSHTLQNSVRQDVCGLEVALGMTGQQEAYAQAYLLLEK